MRILRSDSAFLNEQTVSSEIRKTFSRKLIKLVKQPDVWQRAHRLRNSIKCPKRFQRTDISVSASIFWGFGAGSAA